MSRRAGLRRLPAAACLSPSTLDAGETELWGKVTQRAALRRHFLPDGRFLAADLLRAYLRTDVSVRGAHGTDDRLGFSIEATPSCVWISSTGFFGDHWGYEDLEASPVQIPPRARNLLVSGGEKIPRRPRRRVAQDGGLYIDRLHARNVAGLFMIVILAMPRHSQVGVSGTVSASPLSRAVADALRCLAGDSGRGAQHRRGS
jgi:hypothetical protein